MEIFEFARDGASGEGRFGEWQEWAVVSVQMRLYYWAGVDPSKRAEAGANKQVSGGVCSRRLVWKERKMQPSLSESFLVLCLFDSSIQL